MTYQHVFLGRLVTDTVQLGDLVIPGQGMGAALLSAGFDTVDGILGYVLPIWSMDLDETCPNLGSDPPT